MSISTSFKSPFNTTALPSCVGAMKTLLTSASFPTVTLASDSIVNFPLILAEGAISTFAPFSIFIASKTPSNTMVSPLASGDITIFAKGFKFSEFL